METNPRKSFACLFCFFTFIFLNNRLMLLFVDGLIPVTSYCGRWGFLFLMPHPHPHLHAGNTSQSCCHPPSRHVQCSWDHDHIYFSQQRGISFCRCHCCSMSSIRESTFRVGFWGEAGSCGRSGQQAAEHFITDVKFSRAPFASGIANHPRSRRWLLHQSGSFCDCDDESPFFNWQWVCSIRQR